MDFHIATLTAKGAAIVYSTFVVSAEEAREHAEGYAGLIAAKSGDLASFTTATFEELLVKHLASRLQWRDPTKKAAWERNHREQYDALRQAMGVGRDPVVGKKF